MRNGTNSWDVDVLCVPRAYWSVSTKLDLYKPIVTARLDTYPESSAVRLFEEVHTGDYSGGVAQLQVSA